MDSDRELINQLHEIDMRASKAGDDLTLRSVMADDAVVLPPGGHMIRGKDAIDQSFSQMSQAEPTTEVLEYRFDWQEVNVLGDYAYEWGYIHGSERDRKTCAVLSSIHHVMRILNRQGDGAWKVYRTIWSEAAT